jgi:hypothetical protein
VSVSKASPLQGGLVWISYHGLVLKTSAVRIRLRATA